MTASPATLPHRLRPPAAAVVLGVALSGLFDGILLHQVLQWHHLLSLVPGERTDDLAFQILADGLFHVLMYVLAAIGLVWLWRERRPRGRRAVLAGAVLGFGLWNVLDVVVFHWVMGIHRLRVDTSDPLLWDVGWLLLLGVAPLAAGAFLLRAGRGSTPPGGAAALTGVVAAFVVWSVWPAPSRADTVVVFWPGSDMETIMNAAAAVDARIVQLHGDGPIVTLRLPPGASPWKLYAHRAALVSTAAPGGCLSRMKVAEA